MSNCCLVSVESVMSDVECIVREVRPMRVGVTGTHCSGKTTLVDAIAPYLKNCIRIKEIASRVVGDKSSLAVQEEILKLQIFNEAVVPRGYGFISDRTVIDNLAYCMYVKDMNGSDGGIFERCVDYVERHLQNNPYDVIIHVENRLPMEFSPHRTLTSKFSQAYIADIIDHLLYDVYIDDMPKIISVGGTTEEMLIQIAKEIARCE